jgi:hypothetical protein
VIYVSGNNAILNSNILTVNTATANNGDGGVFHFANTGTNTISLTTPTFSTVYSSSSGGIASIAGTVTSITMSSFTVNTCKANSNYGGGFALTNTASTTFSISTGSITSYSKA